MYNTPIKLTLRIPGDLHRSLKRRAGETGLSLNNVIVETLRRGLSQPAPATESEYDRTVRVVRENGLYEPLGPEWDKYVLAAPDVTVEAVRRIWRGQRPLSEDIVQERRERQ